MNSSNYKYIPSLISIELHYSLAYKSLSNKLCPIDRPLVTTVYQCYSMSDVNVITSITDYSKRYSLGLTQAS